MSKHQVVYIIFGLFSILFFFGLFVYSWSLIYYFIGLFLWLSLVVYGSFSIQTNYHIHAICSVKTNEKVVAITFDDGPTEYTPLALRLLKEYAQKATFFCIGKQVLLHKEIVKSIAEQGHLIGNHTFSHSKQMGFKNATQVIDEIQKTDEALKATIGQTTQYFRPPFGVTNPSVRRAIIASKHTVIGWNIRSLDTVKQDEVNIFNRIKRQIKPGSIILLHDTSEKSIKVLEHLLIYLKEENYKSLTVEDLLKLKS